ncbi:MAG TPA: phosphatidylserine decarboxylase [Myxococcota bacterium]|nr:phosphatidylserine decarboxylase [Myxococcota bacterium]
MPEPGVPVFAERPTEPIVPDAWRMAALPLGMALAFFLARSSWAFLWLGLAGFILAFFRNPERLIPGDERTVVSPADGRVIAVGEVEDGNGSKRLRIGVFLSVFNVHVNRAPLAGRVVEIVRSGSQYLAAFNPDAERLNVSCSMTLETASGQRVRIVQITGLIARRIVCHPRVGEWLRRGDRYGLIRFGSRTDVLLPAAARPRVRVGDRVRGGSSIVAELPAGGAS